MIRLLVNLKKPNGIFQQLLYYGLVGGSAALLDISIFGFLLSLEMDYRFAAVLSFTGGTSINFFMCHFFIFEKRAVSFGRAYARHYFSSTGGFIVNLTVLILLVELVFGDTGWTLAVSQAACSLIQVPDVVFCDASGNLVVSSVMISKLLATGCSFVANFIMIRFYAFNGNLSVRRTVRRLFPGSPPVRKIRP